MRSTPPDPPASKAPAMDSSAAPPEMRDNLPIPAIIILAFVFIYIALLFFRIELRRLLLGGSEAAESERRGEGKEAGLDPAVLASFPVAPYEAVRGVTEGKGGTECPVCLTEFASGDEVRVLTVCCHAFHPACIDPWLAGKATCPVCRSDLGAQPDEEKLRTVMEAAGVEGVSNSEPERSDVVEQRREAADEGTRR